MLVTFKHEHNIALFVQKDNMEGRIGFAPMVDEVAARRLRLDWANDP
jgi:hypothetical protein